jgi:hypothetical protein
MINDGVGLHDRGWHRGYWLNPDVESGAAIAQKTGTIIHSIYGPGAGLSYRSFWRAKNGQTCLTT